MSSAYNIPQFLDYLHVHGSKDDALHVIRYEEEPVLPATVGVHK